MTNQYRKYNLNVLKTIIAFGLIFGSFQNVAAQCYATASPVSFSSAGGSQTTTAQGGCSDGSSFYFQIGQKPSWIASAYNSGNTIYVSAVANTGGSRSGTVQLIRNGSPIGVFSVSQAAGGPPPVGQVSITSGPTSLCQGITSSDYNASATNATSYSWSLQNGGAATINSSSGLVTWNNFSGNATVRVTAYGANNSSSTTTRNVTVTGVSTPGLQTNTNEICPGEQATLTLGPLESSTRYELLRNDQPSGLDVETSPSGTPGGITWNVTLDGTYSVRATQQTSPGCSITWGATTIIVSAGLGNPSISGPNQLCSLTSSTDYNISGGSSQNTYTWSIINGGPASINTSTGVVNWNGFTGTATIRLSATAECGDSGTYNRTVTVDEAVFWYADTDGDGYKDPNGEIRELCDEPTDGNWTSNPQPVDDICPNEPYSQSGSNGCNPACLPFSTNPGTVTFDSAGDTQISTVQMGCSTGYNIEIGTIPDNADNWLAITLVNGNQLNIICQPGTEAKDVTVNLTVNGNSGGGIRVIRNAPPPPPCIVSGFSGSSFNPAGESKAYLLSYADCPSEVFFDFTDDQGNPLPGWITINQTSTTALSVQFDENDTATARSIIIVGARPDGQSGGIGGSFSQACNPKTWYTDSDNDGFRDPGSTGESDCANRGTGWTLNTTVDVCPNEYSLNNVLVDWYQDTDGDGYKDANGEIRSQCEEPADGNWTSNPQPVDDICPNAPYSQNGSNGCNPVCLPFNTNPGTVTFDSAGGTLTSTVELNCTTGYHIEIGTIPDNADNWLAITLINGNVLNIVCQPGSESKDVTVNLTVNGNSGGGIRVLRNVGPPPPPDPCEAGDIADIVFSPNADSQNVTVTYTGNCQGTVFLEHPYEEIPEWLDIAKNGTTFTLSVQDNASGNTQNTVIIPVIDDGSGNRTPIGNFFQITQTSCLTAWYPDSDGDSYGDIHGNPIIGCNDPDNEPNDDPNTSWVSNNSDLCPETPGTGPNQGCPVGEIPENYNTITSRGYRIDNTMISAAKTYYDELGKAFQNQSWDVLTNNMWASETRYDLQGRAAIQTLSAPISTGSNFLYKDGFIKQSNNSTDYNVSDFTGLNLEDPNPVGNASQTLGWYYSESNSNEDYQDITEHPFSSAVFSDLNPGRVLRVAGGNKIDTNGDGSIDSGDTWAQTYTFTMRASQELSQSPAFGSTEYDDDKILKTVSRDVHGVENVVFTDSDGKALASARSGPEGVNSGPLTLDIGAQAYVDIHVPGGITGFSISGSASVTVYDLITEQSIAGSTASLANGFYRVAIDDPDNYVPGSISVTYTVNYYDYGLNEYDEVGRVTTSYQPLGLTLTNKPKAEYQYNTLGQLVYTKSPDEGEAWFKYRSDGQIRYSQNSKQKTTNIISYTDYDSFGRPIESGVADGVSDFTALDPDSPLGPGHIKNEVLVTRYDTAPTEDYTSGLGTRESLYLAQRFLSGNVSFTNNGRQATWFSYDIYGRVEWLIMDIAGLGTLTERYKTIDYEYDPITSQVNRVIYQKDEADQFIHRYSYDTSNQLIRVETSSDDVSYTTHAEYSYYENGALKRNELAGGVQGMDYVYNLAGQLKSLNHPSLSDVNDPGGDDNDLFGMQLDYHSGDYRRSSNANIGISNYGNEQWNGNIRGMRWNSSHPNIAESEYVYDYNRNYWLTQADFDPASAGSSVDPDQTDNSVYTSGQSAILEASQSFRLLPDFHAQQGSTVVVRIDPNSGNGNGSGDGDYDVSNISYDANGNIQTLNRYKGSQNGNNAMDQLAYTYKTTPQDGPNQLLRVNDNAGDVADAEDIGDQTLTENYIYNEIGQLTDNLSEGISYIYNATGLVSEVKKDGQTRVKFFYNDRNHRVKKESYVNGSLTNTTVYVRDISGQVLTIYNDVSGSMSLIEQPIYGLGRVGVAYNDTGNNKTYVYELTDHLGNVRAVFSKSGTDPLLEGYTDYYPFGMPMPERRQVDANGYRYTYQGQEKDAETGKEAFELRLWDARIGRWLTTDPAGQYSSPYLGMGNDPINGIDPDGGWRWRWLARRARNKAIKAGLDPGELYKSGKEWGFNSSSETFEFSNLGIQQGTQVTFNFTNAWTNSIPAQIKAYESNFFGRIEDGLNNSDSNFAFLGKAAYNTADDFYAFWTHYDLLSPHNQPQHLNGNIITRGSTEGIDSGINGLLTTATLGRVKKPSLSASQFSSEFKGTLAKLAPQIRGFINRNMNKVHKYWGKGVVAPFPLGLTKTGAEKVEEEVNSGGN